MLISVTFSNITIKDVPHSFLVMRYSVTEVEFGRVEKSEVYLHQEILAYARLSKATGYPHKHT